MTKPVAFDLPDPVEPASEAKRRERVYRAVADHIEELIDEAMQGAVDRYKARLAQGEEPQEPQVTFNANLGQAILAVITEIIFSAALKEGYFRFPDGYGSFRVQRLTENPRPKRLPTGQIVKMAANRVKFRYEDGAAVREELGLSKKTNYVRRHPRQSRLSQHTMDLLTKKD